MFFSCGSDKSSLAQGGLLTLQATSTSLILTDGFSGSFVPITNRVSSSWARTWWDSAKQKSERLCTTLLNSYQLQDQRLIHIGMPCWNLPISGPELAQLPQLCLVRHTLQFSTTSVVLLNSPNLTSTNLALGNPKLDKVFQMWPNQCWVKGYNTLPWPAGYIPVDTAWWAGL